MKPKYLLFASFGLFVLIQILFSFGLAPLADDLVHYADFVRLQKGEITAMDIYKDLFSDPNRYARPMSPIVLGTMMVLSKYAPFLFFLWGVLFIIPTYLLYKIITKYFGNEWIALLVSVMVMFFPLSSSNLFSPVMQSIQMVVFAFIYSIYLSDRRELKNYIFIGFLSLFSLLFYELNLFLLPILIFLIWRNNKEKKYLKIFLAVGLPILLAFLYKSYFIKLIYPNYFEYGSSKIVLSLDNFLITFVALFKLFFLDFFYIIYKGFEMIKLYNFLDFELLFIGLILSIIIGFNIRTPQKISNKTILISILIFGMTIFVFFISQYPPIAFGFENRILVWVRFSSMLLLGIIFYNLLYFSQSKKFLHTSLKWVMSLMLFAFFTSIISQKNSWILASEYNKSVIKNLSHSFPKNQENEVILYITDRTKTEKLITDEAILAPDYEIIAAQKLYSNRYFNPNNLIFIRPKDYSLYQIGSIKLNKRYKTEYKLNQNGVKIGERQVSFPFYIFDERDNSVKQVNNPKEFDIK